jgi:hypothetical protein
VSAARTPESVIVGEAATLRLMPALAASADVQMAVDEALLGDALFVTARRYVWTPAALSLGKFQRLPEDRLREDLPFDVVRRPSGGRAVLHGEGFEWSFAVVFPPGTLPGHRVDDAYETVSAALAEALNAAGVRLDEAREAPYRSSKLCFACSPPPVRWPPWRRCAGEGRRSCTAASWSVARPMISSPPSSVCWASRGKATGSPPRIVAQLPPTPVPRPIAGRKPAPTPRRSGPASYVALRRRSVCRLRSRAARRPRVSRRARILSPPAARLNNHMPTSLEAP